MVHKDTGHYWWLSSSREMRLAKRKFPKMLFMPEWYVESFQRPKGSAKASKVGWISGRIRATTKSGPGA